MDSQGKLEERLMKTLGMLLLLCGLAGSAMAVTPVPEIDPGSATSAVALLAGSVMILRAKLRK